MYYLQKMSNSEFDAILGLEEYRSIPVTIVPGGAIVTIEHRVCTVFGSGGAWSRACGTGGVVIESGGQRNNGFAGFYISKIQLAPGDRIFAAHGDAVDGGRRLYGAVFACAAREEP